MATRTPIARDAPDWQLVVGAVAIVLGLVLVIMSMRDLEPDRRARHEFTRPSRADAAPEAMTVLPVTTEDRVLAKRGPDRTTTPPSRWTPTVAANRLQASSGADRRAFLLCTTIQTYTSTVSTTPTPRPGRLSGLPQ